MAHTNNELTLDGWNNKYSTENTVKIIFYRPSARSLH